MKKFFIFLLLIIHLNTFAFTGGVKGGMNYTIPQPISSYEDKYSGDFGYTFGGFLSFGLTEKLFLNTELMFNTWQFQYNIENYEQKISADYKLFEMNLLMSYNFINNIYFDFGVFGGYPISYKTTYPNQTTTSGTEGKLFSYGLMAGISYKYNNFLVNIRYLFNLSSFYNNEYYENEHELDCTTDGNKEIMCQLDKFHQFQLLVGYEF